MQYSLLQHSSCEPRIEKRLMDKGKGSTNNYVGGTVRGLPLQILLHRSRVWLQDHISPRGEGCLLVSSISARYQVMRTCSCHVCVSPWDTWGNACPDVTNKKSLSEGVTASVWEKLTTFTKKSQEGSRNSSGVFCLELYCGYEFVRKDKRKVDVRYIGVYGLYKAIT